MEKVGVHRQRDRVRYPEVMSVGRQATDMPPSAGPGRRQLFFYQPCTIFYYPFSSFIITNDALNTP